MSEVEGRIRGVDHVVTRGVDGGTAVARSVRGADGLPQPAEPVPVTDLAAAVAGATDRRARWVWESTAQWYPPVLAAGLRVERCLDLRLTHAILRRSTLTAETEFARAAPDGWDTPPEAEASEETGSATGPALFEWDATEAVEPSGRGPAGPVLASRPAGSALATREPGTFTEFRRQEEALRAGSDSGRLRLLLAAESAGALIAAEMRHAGLPWRVDVHERALQDLLGPRPLPGARPARLESLLAAIRHELGSDRLNPDSPAELLRALHRAGLQPASTRSYELKKLDHPSIAPLLEYKKLSRLLSANGWTWADTWIRDGRFHPDYLPGGVVSGRWATRGGGALQLPRQLRRAVVADDGWRLVVADAAQLEPRILAGLSGDLAMAAAGRGKDLYQGIVDSGTVDTRPHAKIAMLGAMYGSTTGESAVLMPRLARSYPRAIRLVEEAARAGERGEPVTSRLGRSSPRPRGDWSEVQGQASAPEATAADERRARRQAREWGRFTRNFLVQASAAEWALCWMAELRRRLGELAAGPGWGRLEDGAHLVYFLHDEIIVHTPERDAEAVRDLVRESAAVAGRLLFGDFPVEFPVTAAIVRDYGEAKG